MGNSSHARPNRLRGLNEKTAWGLSPSDYAFLWDECPRCFYLKVALKQPRLRTPFPASSGGSTGP